jgi:hypothetical protein
MKQILTPGDRVTIRQLRQLTHHGEGFVYVDEQQQMVYRIIDLEVVGVYGDLEFAQAAESQYQEFVKKYQNE